MGTYFVLGLTEANVRINGQDIPTALSSSTSGAVNDLLMSCSTLFGAQLLARANLTVSALGTLTSCDANVAATQCQARISEALMERSGGSNMTVTAASRGDPTDAAVAASKAEPAGSPAPVKDDAQKSSSTSARAVVGDLMTIATAVASLPLLMAFLAA